MRETLARYRLASTLLVTALISHCCLGVTSAPAAPTLPAPRAAAPPLVTLASERSGPDRVVLSAPEPSIPTGDPFAFTASISLGRPAQFVLTRLRLRHPSERLIYQRTRTFTDVATGTVETSFERGTADLGLRPGVYPVELETFITRSNETRSILLTAHLLIFDGSLGPYPVVPVVRVRAEPLVGADGELVGDPAARTQPLDSVLALCSWALSEPRARLSLSIPAVLIEEWADVADGYEITGTAGPTRIASDTPVPERYARTLRMLREAVRTGRVELMAAGYADPDLTVLARGGLLGRARAQYAVGAAVLRDVLDAEPSTGTAPAAGCLPAAALNTLSSSGIGYVVVEPGCVSGRDATLGPGVRRSGPLAVMVADETVSRSILSRGPAQVVTATFERAIESTAGPSAVVADIGPDAHDVGRLIAAMDWLLLHRWARLACGREVATSASRQVRLTDPSTRPAIGLAHAKLLRDADVAATALAAALGREDPLAARALKSSLIAQGSVWTVPGDRRRALAEAASYALAAKRAARETFEGVSLSVQPVTLSGDRGSVPVTIENRSGRVLALTLRFTTAGGARVEGSQRKEMTVVPRETFTEVPVRLVNALHGTLTAELLAGELVIDRTSARLQGSYLDRIVLMLAALTLLAALLTLIVRRTRSAERSEAAQGAVEAYDRDAAGEPRMKEDGSG